MDIKKYRQLKTENDPNLIGTVGFQVFIDRERAIAILECDDCCYGEGQGMDLSFLKEDIKIIFPELLEKYGHLFDES